jgi:hypothetical protein
MHTHGERTRRKVRHVARRHPVGRVVKRRGTCLKYQDAQVGVSRRKTARDDATSSATYRTSPVSEGKVKVGGGGYGAPPAKIISYSWLIWVGVDIVAYLRLLAT